MSPAEKKASIDPANDKVSIRAQCQLIGLSRSSVYYQPRAIKPKQLKLMNRIDELFTQYPIYEQCPAEWCNSGEVVGAS